MKINLFLFTTILSTVSLAILSCKDVIEEDINEEKIIINSPKNGFVTTNSTITFWWEDLEGADEFQLQIVRGAFGNLQQFILDSTIETNIIDFNFNPGSYEWRIRARNSISYTEFQLLSFTVDSSRDISQSTVQLAEPIDLLTNKNQLSFSWSNLYNATAYIFELRQADWSGNKLLTDTIYGTTVSLSQLSHGTYAWGVKAFNEESETAFSISNFEVDTIIPGQASLVSPADNAMLNDPNVTLSWQSGNDDNFYSDTLYLFTDVSLDSLYFKAEYFDQVYTDSLPDGTYYWRVVSVDGAGNVGNYSNSRSFTVQ